MNQAYIKEAKEYLVHDIAPTLMPNIRGFFQTRLLGLYRNHAEIQINIVNESKEVIKSFGSRVMPIGGAVIVDDIVSKLTLVENAPPIKAYFQAWLIGMDKKNNEAEISLRLVDENRKEMINFGSMIRKPGQQFILKGLDVTATITPKGYDI